MTTTKRKLIGDRSECAACRLRFTSTSSFDKHRVGNYTERRCLTESELRTKGFEPNEHGYWRVPMTAAQLESVTTSITNELEID